MSVSVKFATTVASAQGVEHDSIDVGTSVSSDGRLESTRTQSASPFGLASVPPAGSPAIVLDAGETPVTIVIGDTRYMLRNLGAGDVALYNSSGAMVVLRGDAVFIPAQNLHLATPDGLTPLAANKGLVTGLAVDYYTGKTHAELGNISLKTRSD